MKPPSSRPNILLIVADDHQSDAIGAFGHPVVRTPVLDALVTAGTSFRRAYYMGGLVPALCAPARAALMTGTHLFAAQACPEVGPHARYDVTIAPDQPTLPERFRQAGYATFITGKWHNDPESLRRSFDRGRRIFLGGMSDHQRVPVYDYEPPAPFPGPRPRLERGFSTELFCDAACEFIAAPRGNRPFFAYVALTSPHDPRTPPPPYASLYNPADIPLPPNFRPRHPFDNGELAIRDEQLLPRPLQPAAVRDELAAYYGMISHHDAQIGRVLATIDQCGLTEQTIVVYVSDHGLALGQHGLLGKQNLYEHSVRVPLLFRGPGIPRGVSSDALTYSFDLHPTLCELAGLPAPRGVLSRSLVPKLRNPATRHRASIFGLYKDCQRMVTDGRWKLVEYQVRGRRHAQLFDLKRDPAELDNCIGAPAQRDRIARLRARLARWQRTVGDRWMLPGKTRRPR